MNVLLTPFSFCNITKSFRWLIWEWTHQPSDNNPGKVKFVIPFFGILHHLKDYRMFVHWSVLMVKIHLHQIPVYNSSGWYLNVQLRNSICPSGKPTFSPEVRSSEFGRMRKGIDEWSLRFVNCIADVCGPLPQPSMMINTTFYALTEFLKDEIT